MSVGFKVDSDVGYKQGTEFVATTTANQESSGQKESRPEDQSMFQKADSFVRRNQHWFGASSTIAIVGVEGYWLIRKVF